VLMLKDSLILRPATKRDWRPVAILLEENELPLEGARQHLADILVATADDIIVGCAGVEVYGAVALLRSVAIAPLMKNQGIGKRLVMRLIQGAKQRKVATLYLLTLSAEDYFAKHGFAREPIAQAPTALKVSAEFQGACPDTAVFMSLSLNATRA
jgi:N-acetylglutamate synthase-like GNAT family acetyltransferase